MSKLVPPHGGRLIFLLVEGEERVEEKERAKAMPHVRLSSRETSDLIMLAIGAFSPLTGFMGEDDYRRVVQDMRLADGALWPIPITLSVTKEEADRFPVSSEIALIDDESDEMMGSMKINEIFTYDKKAEVRQVYRTEDEAHPGVAKVYDQQDILLSGPVKVFSEGPYPNTFGDHYGRPSTTRALFEEKGWKTIAAFQTRNPIHRSRKINRPP